MEPHIRVDRHDGDLLALNNPIAPRFKVFAGAFGWTHPGLTGDDLGHFFVVGGVRADGIIQVIHEAAGSLYHIVNEAINFKDKFWIEKIWCDTSDTDKLSLAYQTDGLIHYEDFGKDYFGRTIWAKPDSHWPFFRSRDSVVSVCGVPQSLLSSPMGGLDRVTTLATKGKFAIHSSCPTVQWILDQSSIGDVVHHPLSSALANVVYGLTIESEDIKTPTRDAKNPYPNRR